MVKTVPIVNTVVALIKKEGPEKGPFCAAVLAGLEKSQKLNKLPKALKARLQASAASPAPSKAAVPSAGAA